MDTKPKRTAPIRRREVKTVYAVRKPRKDEIQEVHYEAVLCDRR